ncbi:FAD-dependent oxidoreductase [Dyella acidiphila]|uniref:FAD-dependent monooxygenase n=1 Tax=Dyella acidiphila TaxID=2775866 RepID=A0ABR9GDR0_9GAMM|nr:FAD-dependent oxidoreductase [Dyella acidiphila]MBE1162182.1 FAD-dependent monooxygenase [Dyella acidiphila]
MRSDVLIVGAGPTGLVLALWLTRLGVNVQIIDKAAAPGTTSRALAVQARTLELYQQLELADTLVAGGVHGSGVNLWARGEKVAHLPIANIGEDLTPFPFMLVFPQDQHERVLIERLAAAGVRVQREVELLDFSEQSDHVLARLRHADGSEHSVEATYIAGCDGARSQVRQQIGSGFPGGTYPQVFYVADVEVSSPALGGEVHIDLDEADFLAVFPLAGAHHARLVGTVRGERAERAENLGFDDVSDQAIKHLHLVVDKVHWFSTYRVHHRVTEHFRHGRAFLLGDAAHIHSPVGGQGMNTGIGDAINLAWKLASVVRGCAPDRLLDSYEAERIGFARKLVHTTDRVFSLVSAEGRWADLVRTRLAPTLVGVLSRSATARAFLFGTVSQLNLNYRGSALSQGAAGHVHGGDRLPWAVAGYEDNFASLAQLDWQVHVYGAAQPGLIDFCKGFGVALQQFDWQPEYQAAGLVQNVVYLLRPDTYVALVDPTSNWETLDRYFSARGLKPLERRHA